MKYNERFTPQAILDRIVTSVDSAAYDYIIMGESGPTGKTWLYSKIKELGYNVTELSEYINGRVAYSNSINQVIVNDLDMKVIIILNTTLNRWRQIQNENNYSSSR